MVYNILCFENVIGQTYEVVIYKTSVSYWPQREPIQETVRLSEKNTSLRARLPTTFYSRWCFYGGCQSKVCMENKRLSKLKHDDILLSSTQPRTKKEKESTLYFCHFYYPSFTIQKLSIMNKMEEK